MKKIKEEDQDYTIYKSDDKRSKMQVISRIEEEG